MSPGQPEEARAGIPIVRHFLACEGVNRSLDGKQFSLFNLIDSLRPPAQATYPFVHPGMWVFAQLADGRGVHSFLLQLFHLAEQENRIRSWQPIQRDLGPDPLRVYFLPLKIGAVPFERPGLYEFRLFCDGREIAREPILLEESP